MKFNAGIILEEKELQELLDAGVKVNPMQWIVAIMSSNVDDLLYGSLQGHEKPMEELLERFSVRDRNSNSFRF